MAVRFAVRDVVPYILSQVVGAFLANLLVAAEFEGDPEVGQGESRLAGAA